MNALPLRKPTPQEVIDQLIADHGLRDVFLALLGRLLKRSRPPDTVEPQLKDQPGLEYLSDRERADIGLPPAQKRNLQIDLIQLQRRDFL